MPCSPKKKTAIWLFSSVACCPLSLVASCHLNLALFTAPSSRKIGKKSGGNQQHFPQSSVEFHGFLWAFKLAHFCSSTLLCQIPQVTQGANCPIRSFPPITWLLSEWDFPFPWSRCECDFPSLSSLLSSLQRPLCSALLVGCAHLSFSLNSRGFNGKRTEHQIGEGFT